MKNLLIDTRDVRFVLYEMLDVDSLTSFDRFSAFDHDTFDSVLDLVESLSVKECYPGFARADREGCTWLPETKQVTCTTAIKEPLRKIYDAGLLGIVDSPAIGGMGMPQAVGAAYLEFISAANQPLLMYPALAHGAMMLIDKFGTGEQKQTFVPRMMRGEWGGTMCLTEAAAGSDVGRIATKAVKQADGTYRITGQKIFISAGENDFYSNMIHPVLARIEGDPGGTKGISIFIVPKYRQDASGNFTEPNDVVCAGIEHKMGIKGCVTCTMAFGENGGCTGYLLGGERQGMKIMFNMMNAFRMGTAIQAQGVSSAAMMHAVAYAKSRLQGSSLRDMSNPDAPMAPIISHPDIARTILGIKAHVDAQRLLIYYMFHQIDLASILEGEGAKEAQALLELLVPVCKAGCSDMNVFVTSEAMQVFGGYGFCSDYPIEQMMRNSKILAIFEGANGIQGIDLVMRKIIMNPGQYNYSVFRERVLKTIEKAGGIVESGFTDALRNGISLFDECVEMMKRQSSEFRFGEILAFATTVRHALYMLALAWMHVWSLSVTVPALAKRTGGVAKEVSGDPARGDDEAAFYYGKVLASRHYLCNEFPKYRALVETVLTGEACALDLHEGIFAGVADL